MKLLTERWISLELKAKKMTIDHNEKIKKKTVSFYKIIIIIWIKIRSPEINVLLTRLNDL